MTEDELLSAVCQMASVAGWRYYHIRNSRAGVTQGHTGFPDLVLTRDGRLLLVELKREQRIPTPRQQAWLSALQQVAAAAAHAVSVHVWRPSDWHSGDIERVLLATP
jgi:hypothetical protein